jgi:hypothetical protein
MTASLFLRRIFQIEAVTCAASFALLAGGAPYLDAILGLDAGFLRIVGFVLLPCAALFAWLGSRLQPPVWLCVVAIAGNILWVVDSVAVIVMEQGAITPVGVAFVAAQAGAVAGLAMLEVYGLRRMVRGVAA